MYKKIIDRKNPALIVFLIDQSGSMEEPFGNGPLTMKKKNAAVEIANRCILEILYMSCPAEIRNYFDISVLGYGGGNVSTAFGGKLKDKEWAKTSEVYENPLRIEESREGKIVIWLEPKSSGDAPMCQAFNKTYEFIEKWIQSHPANYPPMVINITDGKVTDGDPGPYAEKIKGLATEDGNVLLYNCLVSSVPSEPVLYPVSETELPNDDVAALMFQISSEIPCLIQKYANQYEYAELKLRLHARGFSFNTHIASLINFQLRIGRGNFPPIRIA